MRYLIIAIPLLIASSAFAGYDLFTRDRISPATILIPTAMGSFAVNNPGDPPVYPASYIRCAYRPPDFSPYADSPEQRMELWETTDPTTISGTAAAAVLPGLRQMKMDEINNEIGTRMRAIVAPYPSEERETWPIQLTEASAWMADHNAATPMLSGLAAYVGLPLQTKIYQVLTNEQRFLGAETDVLGQGQYLKDWIGKETDIGTLLSIAWQNN